MNLSRKFARLSEEFLAGNDIDLVSAQQLLAEAYKIESHYAYSIDNGQLMLTVKDNTISLSNTLIIPICDKTQQNLSDTNRLLEVVGIRSSHEGIELLKKITLNVSQINSPNWLKDVWGFRTRILSGDSAYSHIKNALNITCQYIPETIEYSYLGWSKDHKGIFLTGSGPIGKLSSNSKITVQKSLYPLRLKTGGYSEKTCFDFNIETILNIAAPSISFNAFSFTLLSTLSSIFETKDHKPQFIFFLYGESGVRKTSLAKVYFNLAEKHAQSVPINFTASQAAMAHIATVMRDYTMTSRQRAILQKSTLSKKSWNICFEPMVTPWDVRKCLEKNSELIRILKG